MAKTAETVEPLARGDLHAALMAGGPGIDVNAEVGGAEIVVAAGREGSAGSGDFDGAVVAGAGGEGSLGCGDFDAAVLTHVDVTGDAPEAEHDESDTENAEADEGADDNEDDFDGSAGALLDGWRISRLRSGGRGGNGRPGRRDGGSGSGRGAGGTDGGSAGGAELMAIGDGGAAFGAEAGHGESLSCAGAGKAESDAGALVLGSATGASPAMSRQGWAIQSLASGYREGFPAMLFAIPAAMGISTVLP